MDRQRLGDGLLPDVAEPLRQFVRHTQLFRREGYLDAAVGDDLVGDMLTIDSPELRSGLDDRKEAYAVAGDVGKRHRDALPPAAARALVEDAEHLQRRGRVGQIAPTEISAPLTQERKR